MNEIFYSQNIGNTLTVYLSPEPPLVMYSTTCQIWFRAIVSTLKTDYETEIFLVLHFDTKRQALVLKFNYDNYYSQETFKPFFDWDGFYDIDNFLKSVLEYYETKVSSIKFRKFVDFVSRNGNRP